MPEARYIMIGGFLGAGKSTAALHLAHHFREQGKRVGLITNDQSHGLVDTRLAGASGLPVEEITGGCFCCRFDSLTQAAERLTADSRPEIFLAEPVGSCTDLKATVDYPLRRMYGDDYAVAPLSVLVDPVRALRVLGVETGKSFSPKVVYIYKKQLEEADVILINKIDLLDAARRTALREALAREFPHAKVLEVSAREGTGMSTWIASLDGESPPRAAMEVDYDVYAEGEALLGWLNLTATLDAENELDGNDFLLRLAKAIGDPLAEREAEVAHFKMTLTPDEGNDLGVANWVRSDAAPELGHRLQEPVEAGELIVNLRAEMDPDPMREIVVTALEDVGATAGFTVAIEHLESFRPARPVPTHRLSPTGEPLRAGEGSAS